MAWGFAILRDMITPTFEYEQKIMAEGYQLIAGIDEAGRGPWAGPITAAAVIVDVTTFNHPKVRDSKTLSATAREELVDWITDNAVAHGIGQVESGDIDMYGIQLANKLAMKRAIEALDPAPDYVLTDYVGKIEFRTPYQVLAKGDQLSVSIAAASILAKVHRDRQMLEYAAVYPDYGFEQHKGYGTALHRRCLEEYGPCPIHRYSFGPVAAVAKALQDR